ncbi:hypothetical protein F4777DRAFT_477080 [Nemania sp. FL0916]|nr:hypothetical protein F4777DRAFT_477080 [Nemania sp. FL0916]
MSAPRSWSLSGPSKSRPSDTLDISPASNHPTNRIIHGRVTKPSHTKTTFDTTKYEALIQDSANDTVEKADASSGLPSGLAVSGGYSDGIATEENSFGIGGQTWDGRSDSQMESTVGYASALMAQQSRPRTGGSDDTTDSDTAWRIEQIYLNTILNARHKFTLMPSTWRMHFRGIPLPDTLFYIKTKPSSIRPKIYARTDRLEYQGAVVLRKLMNVHARIQDIRDQESAVKDDQNLNDADKRNLMIALSADMANKLRRALGKALRWTRQDGRIDQYGNQLPTNVRIMELKGISSTDNPDSELRIQREMCTLAAAWRTNSSQRKTQVKPPVLFGFIIMKHIITIVTLDASDPGAIIHVPCQLHMAERNQHQWNALAILVTMCWARDLVLNYIDAATDLQPEVQDDSDDPDI